MSGGVDSSVCAALLKEQGYEVIGAFMQLFDYSKMCKDPLKEGSCCSPEDCADARRVAQKLDIPFYTFNMEEVFQETVMKNFLEEYLQGRTPNPCIHCNSDLKFHYLLKKAENLGAELIATGHYALLTHQGDGVHLFRGKDRVKDQSYFLFGIPPASLKKLLFPLGCYEKNEIRGLARKYGFAVAEKEESQDICFVPDQDYGGFINRSVSPDKIIKGNIIDMTTGKVAGTHEGIHNFTIGQRKGIGVALGYPAYVVKIDAVSGDVYLGGKNSLSASAFQVSGVNMLQKGYDASFKAFIQIRYRSQAVSGEVKPDNKGGAEVFLDRPVLSLTPGQAAVFYGEGDEVIGGGWIC